MRSLQGIQEGKVLVLKEKQREEEPFYFFIKGSGEQFYSLELSDLVPLLLPFLERGKSKIG